ncbi:hypothetical protein [Stenotrophomonas phage RAS14]
MTTDYQWPDSFKETNLKQFPMCLTYTSYATTANFIVKDEEDFVKHLIHMAGVLYKSGTLSVYALPSFEEFYKDRMGFTHGFFKEVFADKPNRTFVKSIKEASASVEADYRRQEDNIKNAVSLETVVKNGFTTYPYSLWLLLSRHVIPGCDTPMLTLSHFSSI